MKYLWMLAAAATLAACHNRSEDEVGATPNRDTTDMAEPWSGSGITADTAAAAQTDSTMGQAPGTTTGDTASVETDPGMSADTTTGVTTDTSATGVTTDTTTAP